MKRAGQLGLAAMGLLLATGCGLQGKWVSESFGPELARDQFGLVGLRVQGVEFTKATIWLRKDKTYTLEAYYGENLHRSTGTWETTDHKITFVDSKGVSQTYNYDLVEGDKKLKLIRTIKGTDVVLELKRAGDGD